MSTATKRSTADAFLDRGYAAPSAPTPETTSPNYINTDWASERQFSRIVVGYLTQGVHTANGRIAKASEHVERRHATELEAAAREDVRREGKAILRDLAIDYGFTWVDLAQMLGVSVPAIRKWRMDGRISPENLSRLAQLSAFARLLKGYGVHPAVWASVPMIPGYTVAPKHVFTPERAAALLDLATDNEPDPRRLLDSIEPGWKLKYDDHGYTVTRFDDGTYGITSR